MAKKRLVLHGKYASVCPEGFELEVDTVAELISGFCRVLNLTVASFGGSRPVFRAVGFDTKESLYELTDETEIHLVPTFVGAKNSLAFIKIVVGVIILAVAIIFAPYLSPAVYSLLLGLGASLALSGVMDLLSPAPKIDLDTSDADDGSKYLGAGQNTVRIGTRIPILYGEHRAFGHYVAFDIDAIDLSVFPPPPAPPPVDPLPVHEQTGGLPTGAPAQGDNEHTGFPQGGGGGDVPGN